MAAANDGAPKAPPVIERFVRQLVIANKAVALYPPTSAIPRDTSEDCLRALNEAFAEVPEVRLVVGKRVLFHEDAEVFPGQPAFAAFAHELYLRKLAEVRFHAGTDAPDIVEFLTILKLSPEELAEGGGFESRLWEQGTGAITVAEAQVTLVEADASGAHAANDPVAALPLEPTIRDRREIDDLLLSAYGGRQRDQLVIARIIGDSEAVKSFLAETYGSGLDGLTDLTSAGERFSELAQIAYEMGGDEHQSLLRSLAETLSELDPRFGRELLVQEVLPEARTSEALAAVVREMGLEDVCRIFVGGLSSGEISREALVRAVRNLAMISMSNREEVLAAAGAAMLGAGMDEAAVAELLEQVAPTRLTVRVGPGSGRKERPVDTVLQLLAVSPAAGMPNADDMPGLPEIREEARQGVTNADIIDTLVELIGMDTREAQFASTMATLEDALGMLVDHGEIEYAADAAAKLHDAAENPDLSEEQRIRVRRAIGRFSRPDDIRSLANALRVYSEDSAEYEAARRLLDALGPLAIQPLLEQLAEEPSMVARKALVDLLSELSRNDMRELGAYVTDSRWYFVRNVVTILGSNKSPSVLSYLDRTLRYPDARVRRETIRALLGNNDRLAAEMLIAALADEDAQNVQLAARYLGTGGVRAAIPTLESVARGEGRGNRENGPRIEAIQTLGRLGAVEALPTLETLAGKRRTLLRANKTRELRSAAESAIVAIRIKEGAR